MNHKHLQEIIDHYLEVFPETNGPVHREYYKWEIAYDFRPMMDDALSAPDEVFSSKLYEVKKRTENIIDSYTTPFNGLVEFSKKEPSTVRDMFNTLFQAAEADVNSKQEAIQSFLDKSHELREKYYPDSHFYKDDMHSVTGYLFLYDPDHNYLFKPTHCRDFADCVEFYDDWGSGENTKLDVFFRMCDETLNEIKKNDALLAAAASRFELTPEPMHPDAEKHILLFDLIYCCKCYNLFSGIHYVVPKNSERKLIQERKEKAKMLSDNLDREKQRLEELEEAKKYIAQVFQPGTAVSHSKFGKGCICEVNAPNFIVKFASGEEKQLDAISCVANALITLENSEVQLRLNDYKNILGQARKIRDSIANAEKALLPYVEYLE